MRYLKPILSYAILLFAVSVSQVVGQTSEDKLVSISENTVHAGVHFKAETPLRKALSVLEEKYGVVFLYESDLLENRTVAEKKVFENAGLGEMLQSVLEGSSLTYKQLSGKTIGIIKKNIPVRETEALHVVEGTVTDASDGSTLPGVNIIVQGTTVGTSTDMDGQYSLNAPSASDTLIFSFIGYETQRVPI